jgi:hypothetical protein
VPIFVSAFGLVLFAFIGWLVAVLAFGNGLRNRKNLWSQWGDTLIGLPGEQPDGNADALSREQTMRLLALVVLGLPIDLFLVSIAGSPFDHYFLALLPGLGVLAAFAFRLLLVSLQRAHLTRTAVTLFAAALVVLLVLFSADSVQTVWHRISTREQPTIVNYILQNTIPRDTIFFWGSEGGTLFVSGRQSPSRFIYISPMVHKRYGNPARASELLTDLLTHSPRWIVVPPDTQTPYLQFPKPSAEIEAMVAQVRAEYLPSASIEGWTIYAHSSP